MDLLALVDDLGLCVPTAGLSHNLSGLLSIDHVARRSGASSERTQNAALRAVRCAAANPPWTQQDC